MAFFNKYPYTDMHELNLDWILAKMRELEIEFDEFKVVNNITFSGQWDITKQYPAWTIVSDNNIGYVSLQPVPVGVPLSNGNYWVEVIDYTAQIAGLENRVIAIENDITNNIKPDILINAAGIADINHKINMDERMFLFVGDSYASQTETWVTPCVQAAGIVNYSNEAVTGTAFYDGSFLNQITYYTGNRDEVTDIVVGGGLNDSIFNSLGANHTALVNAIAAFATYAKANYPNAKLWLSFMGNAIDDAPLLAGRTWDKRSWCKWTYEKWGRANGFTIITHSDAALTCNNATYKSDHMHPNTTGAEYIGYNIANVICTGNPITTYPEFNCSMAAIGNNVLNAGSLKYSVNGYFIDIQLTDLTVNISNDYGTFAGGTEINLVTMSSLYFNKKFIIDCTGLLVLYNGLGYQNVPMVLKFEGNKISLYIYKIKADGSGYETFTKVSGNASVTCGKGITCTIPSYYIN